MAVREQFAFASVANLIKALTSLLFWVVKESWKIGEKGIAYVYGSKWESLNVHWTGLNTEEWHTGRAKY